MKDSRPLVVRFFSTLYLQKTVFIRLFFGFSSLYQLFGPVYRLQKRFYSIFKYFSNAFVKKQNEYIFVKKIFFNTLISLFSWALC